MREISVEEFKRMIESGEDHQLIDVREEYEFDAVNLGGELIPMATVPDNLDRIATDKPVIIHCKSGARSGNIVRYLETKGFTNTINLKGGIFAWIDEIDPSLPKY